MTDWEIVTGSDVPGLAAMVEEVLFGQDCGQPKEKAQFVVTELIRFGMRPGDC